MSTTRPAPTWQDRTDAAGADGGAQDETWTTRCDLVKVDLLRSVEGPGGALLFEGVAAKPGIYPYRTRDGRIVRERVTAAVLARADDLKTLGRAPLTLRHPPVPVTPDNVGEYGVGDLDGEIVVQGGFVRIKGAVRPRHAQDAIHGGVRDLSCGYRARIDRTPGHDAELGGDYDQDQVGREYNHLAFVEKGRHGPLASARIDADGVMVTDEHPLGGKSMNPTLAAILTLLGGAVSSLRTDAEGLPEAERLLRAHLDAEVDPEELKKLRAEAKEQKDKLKTARDEVVSLETTRDAERLERTTLETARDTEKARADAAVLKLQAREDAERTAAEAVERTRLSKAAKHYNLNDALVTDAAAPVPRLQRLVANAWLSTLRQDALPEDAREGYVAGMADAACAAADAATTRSGNHDPLRQPPIPAPVLPREDDNRGDGQDAPPSRGAAWLARTTSNFKGA